MDFGRECLGHEESKSIKDNELNPNRISLVEDAKINNNRSCAIEKLASGGGICGSNVLALDAKGKDDQQIVESLGSPSTVPTKSLEPACMILVFMATILCPFLEPTCLTPVFSCFQKLFLKKILFSNDFNSSFFLSLF